MKSGAREAVTTAIDVGSLLNAAIGVGCVVFGVLEGQFEFVAIGAAVFSAALVLFGGARFADRFAPEIEVVEPSEVDNLL